MSDVKAPNGIDRIVGQRVRWRRRELKLTQEQLGEKLGLTFQQLQKYEKGINRVSAGRLFELADVLSVPIGYFYEGVEEMLSSVPLTVSETDHPPELPVFDQNAMDLLIAFQKITDQDLRQSLLDAVRAAGEASQRGKDS